MELVKKLLQHFLPQFSQKTISEDGHEIINGGYRLKNSRIERSLRVNGEAKLGTAVIATHQIVVNGSLKADGVEFNGALIVNGNTKLINSIINQTAELSGLVLATHSTFAGQTNLQIAKAEFQNCRLQAVNITHLSLTNSVNQLLILRRNTLIMGDIIFQSGIGEVHIDSSSSIQGNVHGARVVQV